MKEQVDDREVALNQVRASLRSICERFGLEYWREADATKSFPEAFLATLGEAGFLGVLIPQRYGGSEAGPAIASVMLEEINRFGGDAAVVNAQIALCGTVLRHGSDDQKNSLLPGIANGSLRLLTVAATEPDSGADMSKLSSTARREGEDWVLEAQKILISLVEHTHVMIVLMRTPEGPTLFLLNLDEVRSHLEVRPVEMIANRQTTALFIDDLRVPDSARLGPVGGGLRCLMEGFALRRVLAASESIGNARFFLERSVEHAKTRSTFGRLIGQNQGVQFPIVSAYAKTEAADLMRWDALELLEQGREAGGRSAMAKVLASEAAWEAGRVALTTFGGWGLTAEYHIERKLRDAMVFTFNNLLLSYLAERVLGLPKAY